MKILRRHLEDERGISLIMTMGIMLALLITGTSVVAFSSSNARNAEYSADSTAASHLAEAGEAYARSILWNASDPIDPNAVGSGFVTLEGETVNYSGTYDSVAQTWTLTGSASVSNLAAGGTITRTATSQVRVIAGGGPGLPEIWTYNYSDGYGGCMMIEDNAEFAAPLYVNGDLCIRNNGDFTGSTLHVEGTLDVGSNGAVGSVGSPIDTANVVGGCLPAPHPCTAADDVYANTYSQDPGGLTKPTIDLEYWYQNASPGPMNDCTVGSFPGGFDDNAGAGVPPNPDSSLSTVDLAPSSSYTCKTATGEISWTPGNPGTMTIAGTIYFDGDVQLKDNDKVHYQGKGTIYASGKITVSNNSRLCGSANCDSSWDPSTNILVLVAAGSGSPGLEILNNAEYQGAAYVVSTYLQEDNAANWGPAIADQFDLKNNHSGWYIPLTEIPTGAPGANTGGFTLENVPGSYTSS